MSEQTPRCYEFGPFRLVPEERQLLRESEPIALPPKAFDTLLILVEHSGHVVRKDDLLQTVWPDAFIEENNLNQYISLLRKALGDGNNGDCYIETVRRYGFRFNADVRATSGDASEASALLLHKRTRTHVVVREETSEKLTRTQEEREDYSVADSHRAPQSRKLVSAALVTAAALAGLAVAAFFLRSSNQSKQTAAMSPIRSIAVLPFKSFGAESSDEYLELGLADALITKLGQIKQINVRPTGAIQKYARGERDLRAIGRELSVDAILDGRIQKTGDQIRVTVQLVRAEDATTLWTSQFDEKLTNLLAVQDSISDQATQAMKLQLTAWQREQLAQRSTANSEAYQAYLRGRYYWNRRTLEGFKKAIEYFQQAIDLDPHYAPAYSGLADSYNLSSEYGGFEPKEAFARAKEAAGKALELDESLPEAHASLAYILVNYEWNWVGAEREFKRAIELNPNYATAHQWFAEYLIAMGRYDEARAELDRALEIDPLSLIINAEQGLPFLYDGQYELAIAQFQKASDLDPNFPLIHYYLSAAYEHSGKHKEAFKELLTSFTLTGMKPEALAAMKADYDCCGMRGVWQRELAYHTARLQLTYVPPYVIAQNYAQLNRKEEALTWLERAYQERDRYMIYLARERSFDSLRSDPHFIDLQRRMNLL